MPFDFGTFFGDVKEARFDFTAIGEWIGSVYDNVVANTTILDIWNNGISTLSFIAPYLLFLFLIGSLAIAFFGNKLAVPIKLVAIFFVAFCLGTCYISPLLDPFVELPHWIMGLIVAAVAAVLYKFIYAVLIVCAVGYPIYMVIYREDVFTSLLSGNEVTALVIAAVSLLLLVIFRKYTEPFGFAIFGGWLTAITLRGFVDYTLWIAESGDALIWIFALLVAVPGFAVQYKLRRRF